MEQEFLNWFDENEKRFAHGQFDDKGIAYSAWLEGRKAVNNNCSIPNVMVANADGCPSCSKKEYHQHRNPQNNNQVRKCLWCKTVWETAP
jgi:hypothetical protein